MSNFGENNGIYGYRQSKREKERELLGLDYREPLSQTDKDSLGAPVEWAAGEMRRSRERWDRWADSDREKALFNSQKEFLVPRDTEERRRRVFVTSPNVVDDALKDYYDATFKQNMASARSESDKKAFDAYSKYAAVPGAEPLTALGNLAGKSDFSDTFDNALKKDEDGALDRIAERYAGYAGMNPKEYRHTVLEPALREKAMGEIVKEKTPKSSLEYLARGAWRNSLMGGLTDLALQGYSNLGSKRYIDDAAMENYNPSRAEQWGAGVAGLLLDAGVFAGIGSGASKITGAATDVVKKRAVSALLSKGAANGLTRDAAEQMVKKSMVNSLSTKIVQSSMNQGITLGVYDAAHSVVDDLLHGESVDATNAAGAFARGAATGTMLGVVGTPLRSVSRGLTGGKKIAASAGVLSAESAVFTASSELQKAAAGIEIEPIDLLHDFGESAATLLAMRMFHWRPSGGAEKLNTVGRLRKEFRFSLLEANEVASAGVNPDTFISNLEKSLNVYQKNSGRAQENVREDYIKLMSNANLSAATRAKLLYIVENKLSSTPPLVVDYSVKELGGDRFEFTTLDAEGRVIEQQLCEDREALKSAYFTKTGGLRRNRIANGEKLLMQSYDSRNFFKQAGRYAQETGIDVDVISDVMYRKANKEQLSDSENAMMNDILQRAGYGDGEVGQMLHGLRRRLEQQYNLNEGSLLDAIDKSSFHCSPRENEALNSYERAIDSEVRALYGGGRQNLNTMLPEENSQYEGLGNDALKKLERENYHSAVIEKGMSPNEGSIPTITEQYGMFADGMRKPDNWNSEFVWNTHRHRHRIQDVERMGQEAQKLGKRLGCDVEIIRDESEISVHDPEYPNKVRSLGWYDEGENRVVINVPNNANISEVQTTVVHEIVGHKGFAELFGNYYYDFLEEVYSRGSEEVRRGIEHQAALKGGSYHAGTDEYLAILSEKTTTTPEQRSIIRRFRDFVRDMLRRFGLYNSAITESELIGLIQRHHSAILGQKSYDSYRRNAFTPFETAWRRDGGYYNDVTARRRYDRYMKQNPELKGIAPGFHEFKRNIYSTSDEENNMSQYRFRHIGEKGLEWLKQQKGNMVANRLEIAQSMQKRGFDVDFIREKTGCEPLENDMWRIEIPDDVDNIEISDYVFRTLRLYDPFKAQMYREIASKKPEMRTKKDNEFLKDIYSLGLPYDKTARLEDIVYEPFFFSAYPGIEKLDVRFYPMRDPNYVLYNKNQKAILVNKNVFAHPDKKKMFLAALQHAVQDIEGQELVPMKRKEIPNDVKERYEEGLVMAKFLSTFEGTRKAKEQFLELQKNFVNKYGVTYRNFIISYPNLYEFAEKADPVYGNGIGVEQRLNTTDRLGPISRSLMGTMDIIEIKSFIYLREKQLLKYIDDTKRLRDDERAALSTNLWKHYESDNDDLLPNGYIDNEKMKNARLSDEMNALLLD